MVLQSHFVIFLLISNSLGIAEANAFIHHLSNCIVQSRFIGNFSGSVTKFDVNLFLLNKLFPFLNHLIFHFTAAAAPGALAEFCPLEFFV